VSRGTGKKALRNLPPSALPEDKVGDAVQGADRTSSGEGTSDPSSTQVISDCLALSQECLEKGLFVAATEECYRAIAVAPDHLPLHLRLGEILHLQGRVEDSLAKLRSVAQTYEARGEAEQAVETYDRILRIAPLDVAARSRLVKLLVETGEIEQALEQYVSLGNAYYQLAQCEKALDVYSDALQVASGSLDSKGWRIRIQHLIGDLSVQLVNWTLAIDCYGDIVKLDPGDERAKMRLVELCLRQGKSQVALRWLEELIRGVADADGRRRAISFLRDVIGANPGMAELRAGLAQLYVDGGQFSKAVAQLEKVGKMYWQAGKKDKAKEVLQQILELDSGKAQEYQRRLGLS
jgi:tetratricopeptide (TPR) repeat protein